MQIAYELTQEDFTQSYSVHRNRSALSKWSRRIFVWIAGLSTAIIVLGFLVKPSVQAAKGLLPFFGLVAAWIAILFALPRWTMRRQFLKQPGCTWAKNGSVGCFGSALAMERRLYRHRVEKLHPVSGRQKSNSFLYLSCVLQYSSKTSDCCRTTWRTPFSVESKHSDAQMRFSRFRYP
jgi:hypothetical protein